MSTLVLLTSCGQKSVIKNDVKARTTAEAYGDGTHVIRPLFMPLSDQAISSFDSPVERVDFVAGGFARMFMNLGAGMGLGRTQLTLVQPVPSIPTDIIRGAKLKRLFFYIEPKEGGTRWSTLLRRVIRGQGSVTFDFLDKMAMKISSVHQDKFESWYPEFEAKSLKRRDFTPLQALFEDADVYKEIVDPYQEKSLVILKYDKDQKHKFLKNNKNGFMYIVHAKQPAKTKKYLLNHPQVRGYFKQIHMLNETLVIELTKDPVVEEGFRVILSENATLIDQFKIDLIEECTEMTCLDMEVPDVDILPMIARGNALKIDAYINANKAPESFQLKGFVEFEIKLKLTF
jgi:hypothetical protein